MRGLLGVSISLVVLKDEGCLEFVLDKGETSAFTEALG